MLPATFLIANRLGLRSASLIPNDIPDQLDRRGFSDSARGRRDAGVPAASGRGAEERHQGAAQASGVACSADDTWAEASMLWVGRPDAVHHEEVVALISLPRKQMPRPMS
jgi:hypothetical protein